MWQKEISQSDFLPSKMSQYALTEQHTEHNMGWRGWCTNRSFFYQVTFDWCCVIQHILVPIPSKFWAVLPIPILILITYKGSLCRGQQCVMIYELNYFSQGLLFECAIGYKDTDKGSDIFHSACLWYIL